MSSSRLEGKGREGAHCTAPSPSHLPSSGYQPRIFGFAIAAVAAAAARTPYLDKTTAATATVATSAPAAAVACHTLTYEEVRQGSWENWSNLVTPL